MNEHLLERRKNKRFPVEVGSLTLHDNDSSKKFGEIVNISKSGLAYRYSYYGEQFKGPSEFDVFWAGNPRRPLISSVHYEPAFDYELSKKSLKYLFGFMKKGVIGVQFGELNEHQISQLEYCVQKHTVIEEKNTYI